MRTLHSVLVCAWLIVILVGSSGRTFAQGGGKEKKLEPSQTQTRSIVGTVYFKPAAPDAPPPPKPCEGIKSRIVIEGKDSSLVEMGCCPPTPDCVVKYNAKRGRFEYTFKVLNLPPGTYTVRAILTSSNKEARTATVAYARTAGKFDRKRQTDRAGARKITITEHMKKPVRVDIYAVE